MRLLIAEHDFAGIAPEIPARWGLVYWDDYSAVYLRRAPGHAALLDRLELRLFPGFGGRPGLEQLARDPRLGPLARAELDPANRNAVTNPTVLVEVLSPGTAEYDRGGKLAHYKQIASLREVVLVAHDERLIEVWRRVERRCVDA